MAGARGMGFGIADAGLRRPHFLPTFNSRAPPDLKRNPNQLASLLLLHPQLHMDHRSQLQPVEGSAVPIRENCNDGLFCHPHQTSRGIRKRDTRRSTGLTGDSKKPESAGALYLEGVGTL